MGSIVLPTQSHFPYTMFGGDAHHPSSESSAAQPPRIVNARAYEDGTSIHQHAEAPADTAMRDAILPAAASDTRSHRVGPPASLQQGGSTWQGSQQQGPQSASHSHPRSQAENATPTTTADQTTFSGGVQATPPSNTPRTQISPVHSLRSPSDAGSASPRKIKVTSLAQIQQLAMDDNSPYSPTRSFSRRSRRDPNDVGPQYEISEMPVTDIIEMVAGLLTKITTTNDQQHEHLHRQIPPPEGASGLSQQTTSVLAFHGKNVPSISILSYLSRIHKYCPTTYEVFLSLLVYFDRMTERVNSGPLNSLRQASHHSIERHHQLQKEAGNSRHSSVSTAPLNGPSPTNHPHNLQATTPPPSGSLGKPAEPGVKEQHPPSPPQHIDPPLESDPYNFAHFFVVDSFNIHRLIIAGVTCASKFFSDVFYTNSRYAKVGGLPLVELNHLELQFLILNDFRLAVPLEEMEAYGTMLVEFYAREVVAQQHQLASSAPPSGGAAPAASNRPLSAHP